MSDTLVLCYHAVADVWDDALAVSTRALRAQLELLVGRGYKGITFTEVLEDRPGRNVAVTFDDAFKSVVDLAAPILDDLGLPGTIFAPTDYIGSGDPMRWPGIDGFGSATAPQLLPASWEELTALVDRGWEIGSHTRAHHRLTEIDDDLLLAELQESKAELERRLGRPCTSLAYPYGIFDERVVAMAGEAGYRIAAVLDRIMEGPSPLKWPRVGVYGADSMARFKLKVSPTLRSPAGTRVILTMKRLRPGG